MLLLFSFLSSLIFIFVSISFIFLCLFIFTMNRPSTKMYWITNVSFSLQKKKVFLSRYSIFHTAQIKTRNISLTHIVFRFAKYHHDYSTLYTAIWDVNWRSVGKSKLRKKIKIGKIVYRKREGIPVITCITKSRYIGTVRYDKIKHINEWEKRQWRIEINEVNRSLLLYVSFRLYHVRNDEKNVTIIGA